MYGCVPTCGYVCAHAGTCGGQILLELQWQELWTARCECLELNPGPLQENVLLTSLAPKVSTNSSFGSSLWLESCPFHCCPRFSINKLWLYLLWSILLSVCGVFPRDEIVVLNWQHSPNPRRLQHDALLDRVAHSQQLSLSLRYWEQRKPSWDRHGGTAKDVLMREKKGSQLGSVSNLQMRCFSLCPLHRTPAQIRGGRATGHAQTAQTEVLRNSQLFRFTLAKCEQRQTWGPGTRACSLPH